MTAPMAASPPLFVAGRPTDSANSRPAVEEHSCRWSSSLGKRFSPGEAFQFDWSEDWAIVAGERTKLQVAHTKLSHSRAFIVRAYLLQTHEMLFDALAEAFRVLGGVPQRGIFDNMKTAVDRIGSGKARQVNARFAAMASHYLFETDLSIGFEN